MEEYDGTIGIVFRRRKEVEFLVIHNRKSGNNTFPAGGREKGEITSLETVSREIREETGYEAQDYLMKPTNIVNTFVYGTGKSERSGQLSRQPVYIAELISDKEAVPTDPDALIEGWYDYKAAREKLTFDDLKQLLDKISVLIK